MSLLSAQQDEDVMAEINITPFTDVLLVLLIIFMILAALVTPPGFQKELPNNNDPSTSQQQNNKKEIDVEVNNRGVIFVDDVKTDDKGVYGVMEEAAKKKATFTSRSRPTRKRLTERSSGFSMRPKSRASTTLDS
jgi:biopolymer transport protein ExbD